MRDNRNSVWRTWAKAGDTLENPTSKIMAVSMDTDSDASSWASSDMEGEAFTTPMPTFNKILSRGRLPRGGFISTVMHYSASCELCKEFNLSNGNVEGRSDTYYLRALPFPTSLYQPDDISAVVSPKHAVWLQAVPCGGYPNGLSSLESTAEMAQMSGWAACYLTTDGPGMFRPQLIPKRFNVAPVKKWLSACMDYHGHICNASVNVPGLLLIDCETLQLCRVSPQPPYVALSYVWAKPIPSSAEIPICPTVEGQSRLPPKDSLSQVVKDSISVTKQLGFRYLWIDKYCINQRDAAIQREQIENMDLIYMSAELSIIAAAGNDEHHGLPGVGVERLAPRAVEIGSFTITHVPTEPWVTSSNSRWATRAWTFQEELLSRRRLFFSEEQVSFICHGMLCCEARGGAEFANDAQSMKTYSTASLATAKLDKLISITRNLELTNGVSLSEGIGRSGKERLQDFMELIAEYNARNLTHDFDALRAFAGIRRVFEEGEYPIYNVQGLPLVLSVQHRLGHSATNLVATLCWEYHQPEIARRRTQFPSWTWAGWTGRIHFPYGLNTSSEFELDQQLISVEYEDGYRESLEALVQSLAALRLKIMGKRHSPQLLQSDNDERSSEITARYFNGPKIIQLHAPVVTADLFSFTDPTDWETGSFAGMQFLPYRARLAKDDMPFSPLYLLNGLAAETLACILLRVDKELKYYPSKTKPPARAHLLLVQWHKATEASRIGKLTVVAKDESFNLAELIRNLKWRDLQLSWVFIAPLQDLFVQGPRGSLKLNFATFGSRIGPEIIPALLFPILAGGSRGRGAQNESPPSTVGSPPIGHLLTLAQVCLIHSSGYSSNGSGPKTEMENAHVEIPISNYLFPSTNISVVPASGLYQ
ncbi:HET-domain-containing protein [Acephala macrosclerotiorum]|nr:HET-domain-containing protein [Acephala macrosclerotiorum]